MPTRSQVRQAVVAAVETVPGLTVFEGRHITSIEESMPCAAVYFTNVDVTEDISGGRFYRAPVSITTFIRGDDADADLIVDQVIDATTSAMRASMETSWALETIDYDHDAQPGTVACTTEFSTKFTDG